jgi:ribonuclease D
VAGAFLTRREQASFADLVNRFLNEDIDKHSTVTRWNRRPLDPSQLAYAAADVHWLLPLYDALCAELEKVGRLEWARDQGRRMHRESPVTWADKDGDGYRRVSKASQLSPRKLAVLRELYRWREQRAREENQRPANILADHKLVRVATGTPRTKEELEGIRQMPSGLLKRHSQAILDAVSAGLAVPDDDLPEPVRPPRARHLSAEDAVLLEALLLLTRIVAQQENIAPSLLAKRDRLAETVVVGIDKALEDDGPLGGWRADLLGPVLHRWMSGKLRFGMDPGGDKPSVAIFDADGTPPVALVGRSSGGGRKRKRRRRRRKGGDAPDAASGSNDATANGDGDRGGDPASGSGDDD